MSGLGAEVEIAQHDRIGPGGVGEGDVSHLNFAMETLERGGGLVGGLGRVVEELADAFGRAEGTLELGDELGKLHEGGRDHPRESRELGEFFFADGALVEHAHRIPSYENEGDAEGENDEGDERRARDRCADHGAEVFTEIFSVAGHLEGLVAEGLHADDALETLLHDDLGGGEIVLGTAGELADARAENCNHDDDDRDGADHDEGELHRHLEDEDETEEEHHRVPDEHGDRRDEGLAHRLHVVGEARGEFPAAALVQCGHGQADDAAEGVGPQRGEGALRGFGEKQDAPEGDESLRPDDTNEEPDGVIQFRHPFGAVRSADALADEGGEFLDEQDRHAPGEGEGEDRGDEDLEMRTQVIEEEARVAPRGFVPEFFARLFGLGHDDGSSNGRNGPDGFAVRADYDGAGKGSCQVGISALFRRGRAQGDLNGSRRSRTCRSRPHFFASVWRCGSPSSERSSRPRRSRPKSASRWRVKCPWVTGHDLR